MITDQYIGIGLTLVRSIIYYQAWHLLVRAECVRFPWLLAETKVATIFGIGPSGVRALPLAAGTNEGGHYFRYIFPLLLILSYLIFFFFLLPPLFKTTEGVVVGFQIFACGPELPIE